MREETSGEKFPVYPLGMALKVELDFGTGWADSAEQAALRNRAIL